MYTLTILFGQVLLCIFYLSWIVFGSTFIYIIQQRSLADLVGYPFHGNKYYNSYQVDRLLTKLFTTTKLCWLNISLQFNQLPTVYMINVYLSWLIKKYIGKTNLPKSFKGENILLSVLTNDNCMLSNYNYPCEVSECV